ncbi:hypothetical protein H6G80_30640 [Nostoc sp. FACHB-87]|uniref:hypothetical protein n=1 Tax=Nostocaceae TaxID=1162 RepID=UPI00168305B0|nr:MULTISPECIES: hypothetical protein [Nostocaceae]MBD2458412.1 hypothetical protein [Nostoc sp. FACHB-87]MBD2479492.1 hypothetical protein [Anabaena sp. FACHB-83]
MNAFSRNNLITYCCIGIIGLLALVKYYPQNQAANATKSEPKIETSSNTTDDELQGDDSAISVLQQNRPLRMTINVESPSFLKVRVGQEIKTGDIISDNTTERDRLSKQKKSVQLQIENLKSKIIPEPFKPTKPLGLKQLPPPIFSEESAAIAQSKLRLNQAIALLEARTPLLQSDNPERRAETEKAEAGLQIASAKVEEQEQLIQSMKDLKLQSEILEHEEAKLKQLRSEMDGANSLLDQARAKLNASAILQQQELQQLQINVRLAQSDLEVAESRLVAAQNRRQLTEYDANLNEARQQQQENQTQQEYSRQQQQYAQSIRDRDYQLAQLNISLTTIEDKLAQIPMIRSPRNGYIRRIKPWVGRNGKYETTITITSNISSKNGGSDRSSTTSTKANTSNTRENPANPDR